MLISMGNCVQNEKERSEYICRRSGRISARLSTGHLHGALKSHLARRCCCCCCCCCRRPNTLTSSTTTPAEPSHRPTPGKCLWRRLTHGPGGWCMSLSQRGVCDQLIISWRALYSKSELFQCAFGRISGCGRAFEFFFYIFKSFRRRPSFPPPLHLCTHFW